MREQKYRFWEPYAKRMLGPYTLYEIKSAYVVCAQCFDHAMQYTGMHDKNHKEIYEGDIVKWGENLETVSYCERDAYFQTETSMLDPVMEVVGNIYENKELLSA